MARPTPQLSAAWTAGTPKPYATKRSAYYAIAKRLVVEKYPPHAFLPDGSPEWSPSREWSIELWTLREAKMRALFYANDECFCTDRWKAFISRVAKFLMFVDERRDVAETLPSRDRLQKEYERAERHAVMFGERAARLKAALLTTTDTP